MQVSLWEAAYIPSGIARGTAGSRGSSIFIVLKRSADFLSGWTSLPSNEQRIRGPVNIAILWGIVVLICNSSCLMISSIFPYVCWLLKPSGKVLEITSQRSEKCDG